MSEIRKKLIEACETYVEAKLYNVQQVISELEAALKLETKCSMGDKYETERAMLHLEFEKVANQAEGFKRLKRTLKEVPIGSTGNVAGFGSIVKTTVANYFIAIPAGEISVGNEKYYAVGVGAPITQIFMGKKKGSSVTFNGRELQIEEIF
ncbi:hypothetical protein [Salinimicrobium sp. WS361]|uniref:hypothetical protein n=1 Tax=Salinimicrobium sp. WS361 TaxID=3425123 RepID=UPI003D6FAEF4